ncbi:hypothetical protein A3742_10225 [Oleiphilus sp. HI0071]|jgi:hypothetical protein|uniref:hypothetical protein n=1 Tax=unclassified Oleiphilus TaxID=2631174 RepID=UPI0007C35814|nr:MULTISPECIES: hypothetical protein [unclassified Oleiphilus]KZY64578.1 hypothetical protein A3737_36670 [Oleiphilus sp. HI0065]KZY82230.1 hypothetical protein A3742_10225 [Oleiphilus sp. HI0071]KZY89055.1 hypothetical protein A3744_23645 [Oleiphilus sp. HI0073]KZZ42937.1 hypothetical protein A3758_05035 [Oleiphilus sp. HI0118]KZZ49519.1 hypothetical protein A3760_21195 [Oleiphilus sp. HI0122]KZZ71098.1 hypothetical protein A3765_15230 [Oleiphilus sp. HI0130]KZZ74440.1 hypothetical protein
MKKWIVGSVVALSVLTSGCSSFQKERDLELYLVGAGLTYAVGKHLCRTSDHEEKCGVGAAAAFVIWY